MSDNYVTDLEDTNEHLRDSIHQLLSTIRCLEIDKERDKQRMDKLLFKDIFNSKIIKWDVKDL